MKKLLAILPVAILSGCSSNQALTPEHKAQLIKDYNAKNTLEISCPSGCDIKYRDPRDKLQLPKSTNGYDVANTLINGVVGVATTVAPWAAVGVIATEGLKEAGDNYNASHNQDSTHEPTVVESTSETVQAVDPVVVESTNETVQVVNPEVVSPEVVDPIVVQP